MSPGVSDRARNVNIRLGLLNWLNLGRAATGEEVRGVYEALMPVVAVGCLAAVVVAARATPRVLTGHSRPVVWGVVGLSAIGGAVAPGHPTGIGPLDVILCAGFAGTCALAATRARRWTWMLASAVAAVASPHDAYAAAAFAALGLSVGSLMVGRRARGSVLGAIVGALIGQALLRLSLSPVFGLSAGLAGGAFLLLAWSGLREARHHERRRARWASWIVGAVVLVGLGTAGVSVLLARTAVEQGVQDAESGVSAAEAGQTGPAASDLSDAANELTDAHQQLAAWWAWPGRLIPVVSQNQRALVKLTAEGQRVASAGLDLAQAASGATSDVAGQVPVGRLAALRPTLDASLPRLDQALATIGQVQSPWLLSPLSDRIDRLRSKLASVKGEADTLYVASKTLPSLLGSSVPQKYLLVVQDPVEQRGAGGVIGDVAILTADDGHFSLSHLTVTPSTSPTAPLTVAASTAAWGTSEGFDLAQYPLDDTFAPDFPTDARLLEQSMGQLGVGPVDGVISVDPEALAGLLKLTGPLAVPGWPVPLSSTNVTSVLLHEQYQNLSGAPRQDFLASATQVVFQRLAAIRLPGPTALADDLGPAVQGGHFLLYANSRAGQQLLSRLGATGALPSVHGRDFLDLVTQDAQANKIDWYLHRSVTDHVAFDPNTGAVRARLTIKLTNLSPPSGQPLYVIGDPGSPLPPGTSQMVLTLYSPLALVAGSEDGHPFAMSLQRVEGRSAYSNLVTIPSRGRVTLQLNLRGTIDPSATYRLDVGNQPTVVPDQVSITVTSGSSSWHVRRATGMKVTGNRATFSQPAREDKQVTVAFSS